MLINDDDADVMSVIVIRCENVQEFVNDLCLVYTER